VGLSKGEIDVLKWLPRLFSRINMALALKQLREIFTDALPMSDKQNDDSSRQISYFYKGEKSLTQALQP